MGCRPSIIIGSSRPELVLLLMAMPLVTTGFSEWLFRNEEKRKPDTTLPVMTGIMIAYGGGIFALEYSKLAFSLLIPLFLVKTLLDMQANYVTKKTKEERKLIRGVTTVLGLAISAITLLEG